MTNERNGWPGEPSTSVTYVEDAVAGERPLFAEYVEDADALARLRASGCRVAALVLTREELGVPRDIEQMREQAARAASSMIFSKRLRDHGYRPWLFVADGWQPASRLARYKGADPLWSWVKRRCDFVPSGPTGEDSFETDQRIRHAVVTCIGHDKLPSAVRVVHKVNSAALVISRQHFDDQGQVRALFEQAFPVRRRSRETRIVWADLIRRRCSENEILVRVAGGYDERRITVECYANPKVLSNLAIGGSAVDSSAL